MNQIDVFFFQSKTMQNQGEDCITINEIDLLSIKYDRRLLNSFAKRNVPRTEHSRFAKSDFGYFISIHGGHIVKLGFTGVYISFLFIDFVYTLEAFLTGTHNLYFRAKIKKMLTNVNPNFTK